MTTTASILSTVRLSCASALSFPVSLVTVTPRSWMKSFARSSLLHILEAAVQVGHLSITDTQGSFSFGDFKKGGNCVDLRVVNSDFWTRVFMSGDLGFAEAYMIGDVEVSDLRAFMDLWIDNQPGYDSLHTVFSNLTSLISGLSIAFSGQTKHRARLNAIASYDQSNELFKAVLSKEMMYSCALWSDAEGGVDGDLISGPTPGDLETAQLRKIHYVLRKLRVKPGSRILEFGSGWGGLSIEAAKTFGCEVDTLTLSVEQKALADERIKVAGLEGRVRVHLMDYRELPAEFEKAFDAFVSIEMIEHVGPKYHDTYFGIVDWALKAHGATAVITATTCPETRYSDYQPDDFSRRYFWPNASAPSVTTLITAANRATHGRFTVEAVENHAAHYPRTLREWGRRLETNVTQDMLLDDFPGLKKRSEFEAFKRKWHYLVAYAGAGFAKGYATCHMLTFIRENDAPVLVSY